MSNQLNNYLSQMNEAGQDQTNQDLLMERTHQKAQELANSLFASQMVLGSMSHIGKIVSSLKQKGDNINQLIDDAKTKVNQAVNPMGDDSTQSTMPKVRPALTEYEQTFKNPLYEGPQPEEPSFNFGNLELPDVSSLASQAKNTLASKAQSELSSRLSSVPELPEMPNLGNLSQYKPQLSDITEGVAPDVDISNFTTFTDSGGLRGLSNLSSDQYNSYSKALSQYGSRAVENDAYSAFRGVPKVSMSATDNIHGIANQISSQLNTTKQSVRSMAQEQLSNAQQQIQEAQSEAQNMVQSQLDNIDQGPSGPKSQPTPEEADNAGDVEATDIGASTAEDAGTAATLEEAGAEADTIPVVGDAVGTILAITGIGIELKDLFDDPSQPPPTVAEPQYGV